MAVRRALVGSSGPVVHVYRATSLLTSHACVRYMNILTI